MSGLGIQDYPAVPSTNPKKKNWIKLSITAFMGLIVFALAAAVISNTIKWLFVSPGH